MPQPESPFTAPCGRFEGESVVILGRVGAVLKICARCPVSRVLSPVLPLMDGHSSGMRVAAHLMRPTRTTVRKPTFRRSKLPGRPSLFGLAPGGVYPAAAVTSRAVRSYRTFSPLPAKAGGMFSVALSLGSPPPDVIRHLASVEPGLSSLEPKPKSGHPAIWRAGTMGARELKIKRAARRRPWRKRR